MSLSPLQFISFTILAGLLIMLTLTWLAPTPISSVKKWPNNVPQWFSTETTSTKMAATGKPEQIVSATKLFHYEQQKETEIIEPRATIFNTESTPWQMKADRGIAKHENALEEMKELDLYGNVIIWREADQTHAFSEMTTEFLQFFPEDNIVKTDVLVNFKYGQHSTSSLGLEADLDTQQVKLLNTVNSQYVPNENNP